MSTKLSSFKKKLEKYGFKHLNWKTTGVLLLLVLSPLFGEGIEFFVKRKLNKYFNPAYYDHIEFIIQTFAMIILCLCLSKIINTLDQKTKELIESEKKYKELSITDGLTQLFNVRYFYERLKIEISKVERYGKNLSIILFDIDNFKLLNDSYGHTVGDMVLEEFGHIITNCLRETDSAYRYGGEEFILLLPETSKEKALIVSEKIREKLKIKGFVVSPYKLDYITVSMGVTQYISKESFENFVHRADQLMYRAKNNGRNQVCS